MGGVLGRSGVVAVGQLLGLRSEAVRALRDQPSTRLLRGDGGQRGGGEARGRVVGPGELGRGAREEASGDLAYRSGDLEDELARAGGSLATKRSRQHSKRQQAEIAFSSLKRVFGVARTLAKMLVGLAIRIAAKIAAYTYAFYINLCAARI